MQEDQEPTLLAPEQQTGIQSPKKKSKLYIVLGLVVIVATLGFVLWQVVLRSDSGSNTSSQVAEPGLVDDEDKIEIEILSDGFSPSAAQVVVGSTIKFVNADTVPHRIASNPHPTHESLPDFDSEKILAPGESTDYVANTAGEINLHDHLTPTRNLTIEVIELAE
jgi:plastocyanin